jgi:hypothetical protein
MRMPLARFTTRRIMIAAAAIAAILGAGRAAWRCWYCWKSAEDYALLRSMVTAEMCGMVPWTAEQRRVAAEGDRKLMEYYSRDEAKYRRAAWRFWEPTPPWPNPRDDLDEELKHLNSIIAVFYGPASKGDVTFEYFDYGSADVGREGPGSSGDR